MTNKQIIKHANKLVKVFKNDNNISCFNYYKRHDLGKYYLHLTGFLNNNYFHITIYILNFTKIEIDGNVTDEVELLLKYIDTVTDLKFLVLE